VDRSVASSTPRSILLDEPNVLLLDEPTNDLDTDMLAALEDVLGLVAGNSDRRLARTGTCSSA